MKNATLVMDLQYGSTGKGQIAGAYARKNRVTLAVTANGPNAGHTFRWGKEDVEKVVFTVLPCAGVVQHVTALLVGPGAVINLDKLYEEIERCIAIGVFSTEKSKTIYLHPRAALVLERHREAERELVRIGSTMKGTSEAMIEKIRRTRESPLAQGYSFAIEERFKTRYNKHGVFVKITEGDYHEALEDHDNILIEGSQGHSLGIHTRFYPYTTSRDISAHQVLADCRIPRILRPVDWLRVIGVCRTYPIRVANRFDQEGQMVGSSGPHYDDQMELDWQKDLGREPELTTVTKLPRRIFSFSYDQISEACALNCPDELALTFCDYLEPAPDWLYAERTDSAERRFGTLGMRVDQLVRNIERITRRPVKYVSYGPHLTDMAAEWSRSSQHTMYRNLRA